MMHPALRIRRSPLWLAAGLAACSSLAQAACLDDAQVAQWLQAYEAKQPVPSAGAMTEADGKCSRNKLHAAWAAQGKKPIGYKAGLTSAAMQKRFQTDKPVWGVLYEGALLPNRSAVPAAFGARPMFEADMLVRVSSSAINRATTPLQVLNHIDRIVPFVELPDLVVENPAQLDGAAVEAINVGARMGVMGQALAVPQFRAERYALLNALQSMQVDITDQSGTRLGGGRGGDLMGQPLNAVVWLAQALQAEGQRLKVGDWISLGSYSALLPPQPGQQIRVEYKGLEGAQPVELRFE
ncbi:2-keto-4-pentenoate hydratase [Comamonas sediminis]|uniref:2-keto-4-pentenoate hydratase n=1 Tax=Comamonas TaxID=283 RepID=UPI00289C168F|nr:fumarylacetoacetate hydrolase [Comamonas sp.]